MKRKRSQKYDVRALMVGAALLVSTGNSSDVIVALVDHSSFSDSGGVLSGPGTSATRGPRPLPKYVAQDTF